MQSCEFLVLSPGTFSAIWFMTSGRIFGVGDIIGHVKELLSTAPDQSVQTVLHLLQTLQLLLELLLRPQQEAGDRSVGSADRGAGSERSEGSEGSEQTKSTTAERGLTST